jgi:hypothetical protein
LLLLQIIANQSFIHLSKARIDMNIKNILVSTALLAAATTAFADGAVSQSDRAVSVQAPNVTTIGMEQAPGPSLVYFSDASYPVQPQVKSNVTRAEVKAALIQARTPSTNQ